MDIASGDGQDPFGYVLAQLLGAKAYIGVDKFFDPLFEYFSIQGIKERYHISPSDIPFAAVKEDALDFLKRIPDNSASILTCALTGQIGIGRKYATVVEKEIARVLDPNGAYISMFSDFDPKELLSLERAPDGWESSFIWNPK